jgi:PiT family inorganic phosphate transporter
MALVIVIIVFALIFDFLNGFHDSANSIATVVTTRVLKPQQAVVMAAVANFIAAFFFTTSVAATIGKGIIEPSVISPQIILAGLLAASIWNIITWQVGLPISSSHALIGGLIGAAFIRVGASALITDGIFKTFAFIFVAPLIGMAGAIIFTSIVLIILKNRSNDSLKKLFAKLQILSSFLYSVGHGGNDAQKTMGIIALTLFSSHLLGDRFYIPVWVILASHAAIAIGTLFGGWKIVKTMGSKIIPLKPFEGFCAEIASAVTLFATSYLGIPVSTTHVITGSIIGVGSVENYKKVKWITTRKILIAWILTIPIASLFGMILSLLIG